jgi:hypothetical protein
VTPNGQKQTVVMPLSDFKKNINGGDFDFVHLKDWTLNNLRPVGAAVDISNFVLVGNCIATPVTPAPATTQASTTKVSNVGSVQSGSNVASNVGAALAAIAQFIL